MKLYSLIIISLLINFGALALGGWLMNDGPMTEWYINLNQAPWTPPGWVFSVAWTIIMICFSVFFAFLYKTSLDLNLILLFSIQLFLNIIWNYVFFNQHFIGLGLIVIVCLTLIIGVFLFSYHKDLGLKSLLILPYLFWLLIATSLNAYIFLEN